MLLSRELAEDFYDLYLTNPAQELVGVKMNEDRVTLTYQTIGTDEFTRQVTLTKDSFKEVLASGVKTFL